MLLDVVKGACVGCFVGSLMVLIVLVAEMFLAH